MSLNEMTISKHLSTEYDRNYETLRKLGVDRIEQLAGKFWTDYNVHDPGITILELLCYALTDLGYRIDHPIEDLLAEAEKNMEAMHRKFASAKSILTTCPVSELDYRKLFIDLDGVRNAWILKNTEMEMYLDCKGKWEEDADSFGTLSYEEIGDPQHRKSFVLQGLYNLLIDFDHEIHSTEDEAVKQTKKAEVLQSVKEAFHRHRNLCEDLISVAEVPIEKVKFCLEVELEPNAKAHEVHAEILFQIHNYLNPRVLFYSLEEMQEKENTDGSKKTIDQIFNTPVLEHGFIDDEELLASALCREVRASDLMAIIMSLDGVKIIKEFYMSRSVGDFLADNEWILLFHGNTLPDLDRDLTVINYHKSDLPIMFDEAKALDLYEEKLALAALENKQMNDLPMPHGQHRKLAEYRSIQLDFPDTYGINAAGLPASAGKQRQAQAKQLKAYLLFFDQLIALYMKHISGLKDLLSPTDQEEKTYFSQGIHDVPGIEQLMGDYAHREKLAGDITQQLDNYHERKNRFLNHLIGRYGERFGEYTFLMRELYGGDAEDLIIRHKVKFLKNYPSESACRASGFDYYKLSDPAGSPENDLWDTENVSGVQKRVSRLSGIRDHTRRNLSSSPYEVFVQTDSEGEEEWYWTVKDGVGNDLISNTDKYINEEEAYREMWLTIMLGSAGNNYQAQPKEDTPDKYKLFIFSAAGPKGRVKKEYSSEQVALDDVVDLEAYLYEKVTEDGIYLIEHILLRPAPVPAPSKHMFLPVCVEADCTKCGPLDPYSFRVSVILPGWTNRLSNIDFRKFMDKLIRTEMPAHVLLRICFIDQDQMQDFEVCYRDWLIMNRQWQRMDEMARNENFADYQQKLEAFIHCLNQVHTIYPEGTLSDCSDSTSNHIILNRTNLGTLNQSEDGND